MKKLNYSLYVLFGLSLFTISLSAQPQNNLSEQPKKLAVYYGWPMSVNGSTTIAQAVDVFDEYDIVVFGGDLVTYKASDISVWNDFKAIVAGLKVSKPTIEVFGYIELGIGNGRSSFLDTEISRRVDLWEEAEVSGILLDEADSGYGVDRIRQNNSVDAVHNKGLKVMMNSWSVDEALEPQGGVPPQLGSRDDISDYYMLESFMVKSSEDDGYEDFSNSFIKNKYDKANSYNEANSNLEIVALTTTSCTAFDDCKFGYAWWSAYAYGFEAMGWGEVEFSSTWVELGGSGMSRMRNYMENKIPYRDRPISSSLPTSLNGTKPDVINGIITRNTNNGKIEINTHTHTAEFQLTGSSTPLMTECDRDRAFVTLDLCVPSNLGTSQNGVYRLSENSGLSDCECYNHICQNYSLGKQKDGYWYLHFEPDCAMGMYAKIEIYVGEDNCDPKVLECID